MSVEVSHTTHLLQGVKTLVQHQRQLEIARGEQFNIYSIMRVGTKENATHSNFLGELLNPKGSHRKGDAFLKLFLEVIENTRLDASTTKVTLEFNVGKIDRKKKTGGRIDILLQDKSGYSISIENKIHAKDQEFQIERYVNFREENNDVYYLTLKGGEPSKASMGELESGKHFYLLSYKNDIIDWLGKCLKESAEQPILRESIKQYSILLRKLTHTMNTEQKKAMNDLLLNNYKEASYIAQNLATAPLRLMNEVRDQFMVGLKEVLGDDFEISKGSRMDTKWSQVWVKHKTPKGPAVFFGVESFSGRGQNPNLFIGTNVKNDESGLYVGQPDVEKVNAHWADIEDIPEFEGIKVEMLNPALLKALNSRDGFQKKFVEHLVSVSYEYIQRKAPAVKKHLESLDTKTIEKS